MKLRSRYHLFVCTKADETETRTALEEDFRQNQGKDKRNYLVVVDDEDFYNKSKMKSFEGVAKVHQALFGNDNNSRNEHKCGLRDAACFCNSCIDMDYPNCQLKHEEGRIFKCKVIEDEDSSYNLTFLVRIPKGGF